MADLVTDANNRPFSVIDDGWAVYSPLLPGDGGWADDFSKPNDKFKDMHLMAEDIVKLGMRPDYGPALYAPNITTTLIYFCLRLRAGTILKTRCLTLPF